MNTVIELLRDRATEKEIISGLTDRQLIGDYRKTVAYYNDVIEHHNTGSEWHLGEPMRRVVANAKWSVNALTEELLLRGIEVSKLKNIQQFVTKLTQTQLEEQADTKAASRKAEMEAAKEADRKRYNEPIIANMNKLMEFMFNYEPNFIAAANIQPQDHMESKFRNMYEQYGSVLCVPRFWAEMDSENKNLLMTYIINK